MSLARRMVVNVGMGDSGLVGDLDTLDKEISGELKKRITDDIVAIMDRCLALSLEVLEREKVLLEKMADQLVEKKTLEYDEVTALGKLYGVGKKRRIEERGLLQEFIESMDAKI